MDRLRFTWVFILFSIPGFGQIVSDFASNAEGWTNNGLAPGITYSATGGNPNGYVSGQTPGSIPVGAGLIWLPYFFDAPGTFEGNRSSYYGGNLRFDASQTSTGPNIGYIAAQMTNSGGVSIYFYPTTPFEPPAFGAWATFDIPLSAVSGEWKTTNSATGTAATQAQILAVMTSLTSLQIQGLFRNANVVTRIDNITMYPPIVVSTQPVNRVVCEGVTTTFNTLGANNPNITYHWQLFNPFSGWADITNTGGYSNATTATLSVNTTGNFGAGSYRARISGTAVDDTFSNTVTLTINALPTAPGATGASSCGPANLTLTATGATAGQYRWYTVPTAGTAIAGQTAATYATGVISATTNYYVAINNGTCESARTLAVATINITAAPGVTGASSCVPASLILTATGGTAGQYRWYTVPTLGTAIAGQTNNTYTTPSLTTTTTYYVAINISSCESTRTSVTATINIPPNAPTTTGANGCSSSPVTLSASGGSPGLYRWYTTSTGGTAISGETSSTYATPLLATSTTYYVSINDGACESPRTSVNAAITTAPGAPTTTGNASCNSSALTLNASGGVNGQYRWYSAASGGAAIAGQFNSAFVTPVLTTTTSYYVSINNGTCESSRTVVTATISTPPAAPTTTGATGCSSATTILNASGGANGQYRWYTVATGGVPINGEVNNTFTTPILTTTTTYYVSINNGTCESTRTSVTATIQTCVINQPPSIASTTVQTSIQGKVTVNIISLLSDPDNNLDLSTLKIIVQPLSGAKASIDAQRNLILDYKGISFSGKEKLTIEVCDLLGACSQKELDIDVAGDIIVYNGISPNGDMDNDFFFIQYIDVLDATKKNHVFIYNRWGDLVFDVADYDNKKNVFKGLNSNGNEIPSGTYFYKIEFSNGRSTQTGYLEVKK